MSRLQKNKRLQAVEKPLVNIKNGVAGAKPPYRSSAICATASCSGFVWLTASILAWSRGGSPTFSPARTPGVYAQRLCTMQSQQSIHSLSPRERGLGIGIENSHYLIKNRLFLQAGAVCKKQTAHFSYIKRLFNVIRLNYRFACQCTNYVISIDLKAKKGYT